MSLKISTFKTILNGIYFSGLHLLSAPLTGGLGAVLMLHHVRDGYVGKFSPNAHLTITPGFLDKTLASLRARNIDIVSLDEAVNRVNTGQSGRRFVVITFDDGYRDNAEIAAPILRKYDAPYTVFVATGLIEGTADLWWDILEQLILQQQGLMVKLAGRVEELDCSTIDAKNRSFATLLEYLSTEVDEFEQRRWVKELAALYNIDIDALRKREMMTWSEVRKLAQDPLCTIGAHTIHHYALARLSAKDARNEIEQGARVLEAELGARPKHFAYPYGNPPAVGQREFDMIKELGFASAVTTRPGAVHLKHKTHLAALPRISLNGRFQRTRYTKTLLSGVPALLANRLRRINVG